MDGSRKLKIAALGTVSAIQVVGFATPSWAFVKVSGETESRHYGLWQHCISDASGNRKCSSMGVGDQGWLRSVQVLESVSLVGLVTSIVISSVLKCFKQSTTLHHRALTVINVVIVCGTGICIIAGAAVFGTSDFNLHFNDFEGNPHGDVGYSFFMCTGAGGFLLLIYTPMLLFDMCRKNQPQLQNADFTLNKDKSDINSVCQRHSTADFAQHNEQNAQTPT